MWRSETVLRRDEFTMPGRPHVLTEPPCVSMRRHFHSFSFLGSSAIIFEACTSNRAARVSERFLGWGRQYTLAGISFTVSQRAFLLCGLPLCKGSFAEQARKQAMVEWVQNLKGDSDVR